MIAIANLNDVVSGVYNRFGGSTNISSSITSGVIIGLGTDAINDVSEFTGTTIDSSDIPSKFLSPVTNLSAAYVVAAEKGIKIDTEVNVGNISLRYTTLSNAQDRMLDFFIARAEDSLRRIGQRLVATSTTKAD